MKRIIAALAAVIACAGCATVGTGQRGVVLHYNKPTGEIKQEGQYGYNIFADKIVEMDVLSQTETIDVSAGTADNQHVDTKVSVNYSVDPSKVSLIYDATLGDFKDKWIFPSIHSSMTNEIGRLHAPELNQKRTDIQNKVDRDLKALLNPRGVLVSQVLITSDFRFTDQGYAESISRLAAARNDVLTARSEAQANFERAKGQQQAQSRAITPLTLQREFLRKWDGHLPHTMAASLPFLSGDSTGDGQPVQTQQPAQPQQQQQQQPQPQASEEPK